MVAGFLFFKTFEKTGFYQWVKQRLRGEIDRV
ncbi:hypothetical protein FHT22_000236 [Pedobacter sp. SG918]|nr:hypothetical protein [Pedobacter sp. SG918]